MFESIIVAALAVGTSVGLPTYTQDDAPNEKQVARSVAALEKAFEAKTDDRKIGAIQAWEPVAAPATVELLVEEGLEGKSHPVAIACIEVLGNLEHEDALESLERYLKRNDKRLRSREDRALLIPLLKAIGRHGSETSIDLLMDDVFLTPEREVVRARLMGLANIRSERSVAEICELMRKVDRRKVQPHAREFRLALVVLTGVDRGTDLDRWGQWWNDNKKTFELPERAPKMPQDLQRRWEQYWGLERTYDRQKRRSERGDDDDRR